jgi:hypothetical protein
VRTMTCTKTRSRRSEMMGAGSMYGQVSESCVSGIAGLLFSQLGADTAIEAVMRSIVGRSTVPIQ